ncbi:hypothetical protein LVB87_11630 [Lysobacter sp. KIS68-7]|uniref:hypothetical protein n=1 Tax=Lysobacter sp. KIS68-7 TaxID=2904252 RepID=UPI001E30AEC2|nr:hypothetical protein [Lysobacter sp. KIS68-7]UHQ18831.1 hypothetical protein LVB87_11630 [Lysobacter sp. KIS68-7]
MHGSQEIEREYEVILEALDKGVVPSDAAIEALLEMGFLEEAPDGYRMTLFARLKLDTLRIKRERETMEQVLAPDVSALSKRTLP